MQNVKTDNVLINTTHVYVTDAAPPDEKDTTERRI